MKKATLLCAGGGGSVTGANFLFEYEGLKILIDCGLVQGGKMAEDSNWEPFLYDPKDIDVLIITHAHLDHIGRIPKLIHEGFDGVIYSTPATKDLTALMLEDTISILGGSKTRPELADIYHMAGLRKILSLWKTHEYHDGFAIQDISVVFKDAGHILGSAMVYMTVAGKNILFTGDLGNSPSPILPDTEPIQDIDYLIMESVYGDRNHKDRDVREERVLEVIQEIRNTGGVLLAPVFSLERTQEMLFLLNSFASEGRLPEIPIYLDSPLAIRVTEVFKKYNHLFKKDVQDILVQDPDVFDFPRLKETLKIWESKDIKNDHGPRMIIAASGMSEGGRIVHHEKQYLGDPNTIILFTGYQSLESTGRKIQEGARTVRILDEEVSVRALVRTVTGFSGHKDSDNLVSFVSGSKERLKKVFIGMGELSASTFLAQRLSGEVGVSSIVLQNGQSFDIEL
jgi:metallo-beta-lactamase family protein